MPLMIPERLDLLQLRAPRGVDRQHAGEVHIEVFLRNGRADCVGVFAEEFRIEHRRAKSLELAV